MSSILRRLSNTPSASVDRDPPRAQSSTLIGSSSILRKLTSTVSSPSLSVSSRPSSSLWTSVTSKAHILFSKSHTSNGSRNGSTQHPRIKAVTKLCTIHEDPANDSDNDKDEDPREVLSGANGNSDSNHPNVKNCTASKTNNTLHSVLAVDYQAPFGPFYMPRAIGIVVQPKTKNQSLLPSCAKGPVALRAPRKSCLTSPLSSQKTGATSPNASPAIPRLNAAPSTSRFKSPTTTQKHVTASGTAHQRKDKIASVRKQSSAPSKVPFPKGETRAITLPGYSRPTNPALSKKGGTWSLSLNPKTGIVGSPTQSRRLAAPPHSTSNPLSKSGPMTTHDLRRSKPLPALPRVALQHRISIKSPSFIPVSIVSSSDESEETNLSTPTRVGEKWRGSLTYPTTTKPSRLPTAGGSRRGGRIHPQQRPRHQKNTVKTSLPFRTALSSVKNTYQVPPAPVQTSISPIPDFIPAVGNKGLTQDAPSKQGANVKRNIQRGRVIASSAKARSPREVCAINAFAACPSPSDEFVDNKYPSQPFVGARPTSSFIPAVSPATVDSQALSRCGSCIRTKRRRSKDHVDSASLLGTSDHRVTLSIVSSGSLGILSNLGVSVGTAVEDSILAERPLSGLFSFQTEVPMLSLMDDFPDSSSFLQGKHARRQSNPRLHPSYSSFVRDSWTKQGHRHTVRSSTDEDRFSSSYSLPLPKDRSTVEEMNEAKAYLENFPEWVIEEDTTFIMTRFSNAYPSSLQFYPSPSDSSSLPSLPGMAQNEPASSSSQDRVSMVLSLTSDTNIILRDGANRPPSSIAWESDQLSARMKSLEEDVWTGLHSTKIPCLSHAEGNDTVRISSCFGLSGVSDTNSLFDLSTSWGRFGGNLLDINLP